MEPLNLNQFFTEALRRAIAEAGSQTALAKRSGVPQTRISEYLSGRYEFKNVTIGTLLKLFPELQEDVYRHLSIPDGGVAESQPKMDETTSLLLRFWEQMSITHRLEVLTRLSTELENRQAAHVK